jgi:DNA polymerase
MPELCCVDFETCSAAKINNGAAAYAEHPSTIIWCASFGFTDGSVVSWVPCVRLPDRVKQHIASGGLLLAHNAGFEIAIWKHILVRKYGWRMPRITQWRDTQPMAAAANLPISLEGVANVFKGSPGKDMKGNKLMKSIATATENATGGYDYPTPTADEMAELISYCEADVRATLYVYSKLPPLTHHELAVWHTDQRINQRGVCIDLEFVDTMAAMANVRKESLSSDVFRITGSLCANSTSAPALKAWLRDEGVELPVVERTNVKGETVNSETLAKDAVNDLLNNDDIDGAVRAVLDNRVEANKITSLAKLKRVRAMVNADGRLRGALRYSLAHTGRWASSGIQVHNLPKDKRTPERSEHVRRLIAQGRLDTLLLSESRPLDALSSSLRSMIIASPGHDLLGADYSAIEARVLAWLSGSSELLDTFERGEDVYVKAARDIGSDDRQLGKVCVLALGYGMGPLKFIDTARRPPYNVELSRKEALQTQRGWRDANPDIVQFWYEVESAAKEAIKHPGKIVVVGHVRFMNDGRCLLVRLPSGRCIRYWRPWIRKSRKVVACLTEEGEIVEKFFETPEIQFFTVGKNKSRMTRESTYGGKLVENITQAVARDLLAHALVVLDRKGFAVVIHVHDSIVAEVAEGTRSIKELCYWMSDLPKWATGLPLTAEGYRGKHFAG